VGESVGRGGSGGGPVGGQARKQKKQIDRSRQHDLIKKK
jgi:hypothetical protein